MVNGTNQIGVTFSQISWFTRFLTDHPEVTAIARSEDVVFDVSLRNGETRRILLCNEYTFGLPQLYRFNAMFEGIQIFMVGGNWNGYDIDSKRYCLERNIGLYNSKEIFRALCIREFWNSYTTDRKGNKYYLDGKLRID